ncbi:hypothetical protein [Pseudomonas sp. NPDC087817]|uniref:hypothetical protein n=1 Tax=Pseudomonas sp. NPDC087817 TaxID=3364451 RepID=UPI0037FC890B
MGVDIEVTLRAKHEEFTQHSILALSQLGAVCAALPDPLEVGACAIGEREFVENERWRLHPDCRVVWNWRSLLERHRKKPKKLEAAFYSQGILCGLMYARVSRGRVSLNVRYIEGNPCPMSPLKGFVLPIALIQADIFAKVIGAKEIGVSRPAEGLIDAYLGMSFQLTESDRRLEARGIKPRYHQLVRKLQM